jgi:hypothetical protein
MGRGMRPALVVVLALLALVPFAPWHARAATFGHARVGTAGGRPALLVDGKPFFFYAGAFFYPRIPPEQWADAMVAMRRLGANTLDLYVPWNWHEVADGQFDFDGRTNPRRDLRRVLRLARSMGFHLIVRPGPMSRNEWRNGGYPAWLLSRPEYGMPQHDILEGRYAATATLQNAHSNEAAAQWLRNPVHLRYAERWLRTTLGELKPYADLVLAVQLDDDQAAYTDNQTWPAPNLQRYLRWLDGQVRAVIGPTTPTFINTFDMKVPGSAPVWAMNNWYGTAYQLGEHERTELDFATAILTTQPRVPLGFSEFQAGWLAAPEDPLPRSADPANTTLALAEALAWGAHGVVMFPMQDTLAPFGWEAPFANAFYAWDAALPRDPAVAVRVPERRAPVEAFGAMVGDWGAELAASHRVAVLAIAYGVSALDERTLERGAVDSITARFKDALRACTERGLVCDTVDLRFADDAQLRRYRTLIVPPLPRAPLPTIAARLARLRAAGIAVVDAVPDERGSGIVPLASENVTFGVAANWTDAPLRVGGNVRTGERETVEVEPVLLAPRSARLLVLDLRVRAFVPDAPESRLTSTCRLLRGSRELIADASGDVCTVTVRDANGSHVLRLENERMHVPSLLRDLVGPMPSVPPVPSTGPWTALAAGRRVALVNLRARGRDGAIAYRTEAFGRGDETIVLENAKLRAILVPGGGARLVVLQRTDVPGAPLDATNATGALRDDALVQPPPSRTDRIAAYTHSYPAGTFNRPYRTEILTARGAAAVVRFTYEAPDIVPRGARFEKTVTLEADAPRLVVDERVVFTAGRGVDLQRAVSYAALALPEQGGTLETNPRAGAAGWNAASATAIAVSWNPGAVERATWTPYRSTGTLMLVAAPGTVRTSYAVAPARSADEAVAFARAEREWIAANPNTFGPRP